MARGIKQAVAYGVEVQSADIASGTITGTSLTNSAVVTAKIGYDCVTANHIQDACITSALIAAGTIAGSNLTNSAVVTAKIGFDCVTADHIQDACITNALVASRTLTTANIKCTAVTVASVGNFETTCTITHALYAAPTIYWAQSISETVSGAIRITKIDNTNAYLIADVTANKCIVYVIA